MSGRMFCNYWTDEMSAGVSVRFYCCLPYGHAEEHKLSKELLNAPPPAAPDVTVARYTYTEAGKLAHEGLQEWAAKGWNKKWWKRIDGTPIPNDLISCIAERFARDTALPTRSEAQIRAQARLELYEEIANLKWHLADYKDWARQRIKEESAELRKFAGDQ